MDFVFDTELHSPLNFSNYEKDLSAQPQQAQEDSRFQSKDENQRRKENHKETQKEGEKEAHGVMR